MIVLVCAAVAAAISAAAAPPPGSPSRDAAVAQLLALHQELLEAIQRGDSTAVTARESDDYVTTNRGEVAFPTREERNVRPGTCPGLQYSRACEDVIAPVVQVSPDGQLGWVIAQVSARGSGDGAGGHAWIELYERREGRWVRVGIVCDCGPEAGQSP